MNSPINFFDRAVPNTSLLSDRQKTLAGWVNEFGDELYSWACHKIADEAQAADLVQDSFLAAFQSFDKFQEKSTAKTWLFTILNNKITDHYRKAARTRMVGLESINDSDSDLQDQLFDQYGQWKKHAKPQDWHHEESNLLDNPEFGTMLQSCMGKLPTQWYLCMQMKYISGKEGEIICQELSITPSNFWQILHRAKLHLRKCLETSWFNTNPE